MSESEIPRPRTEAPQVTPVSSSAGDRVRIEFHIDDLVGRLIAGRGAPTPSCSGCNGCSAN